MKKALGKTTSRRKDEQSFSKRKNSIESLSDLIFIYLQSFLTVKTIFYKGLYMGFFFFFFF